MSTNILDIKMPADMDRKAAALELARIFKAQRERAKELSTAALLALPMLMETCRHRTGSSYHLRAMLFSLWNGKATSLLEIVNLDAANRDALLTVMRAWGCDGFYYDQLSAAFKAADLYDWFIEEGEQ